VHKRALEGEEISPDEAKALVEKHLRVPYAYRSLEEDLRAAAERRIGDYIQKNSDKFKNLEFSEKGIEIALGDGVSVVGRIDLVRRLDSDEVTIVDLKSSERAQAEEVTETQLHIYALGYQQLTGRRADYVETYELDNQVQKARSVDDEMLAEIAGKVKDAANALRINALPPKPHIKTCTVCDYCDLCSAATPDPKRKRTRR
jgi:DNA helicase-2/ATP-dependent DNA helicase PcrA